MLNGTMRPEDAQTGFGAADNGMNNTNNNMSNGNGNGNGANGFDTNGSTPTTPAMRGFGGGDTTIARPDLEG